jgi:hypothetical protein
MNHSESQQLIRKITSGVELAAKRLLEQTQKENGYLVISRDGKVVRVRARDLK